MSNSRVSKYLKLSPNEIETVVKEEKDKWRKFRLKQVRAQAKEEASKIRKLGKEEEELRKNILRQSLKEKWEQEQKEQLLNLNLKYNDNLRNIGEAHKNADEQRVIMKDMEKKKIQSSKLAQKRGMQAMQTLSTMRNTQSDKENLANTLRQTVKAKEYCRSMKIANMPTPEKFKPKKKVTFKAPRKVEVHKAGTFTISSYIPPPTIVQKEISKDITAHEAAACHSKEESEKQKKQEQKLKEEQHKIEERGCKALKKEKLKELQMHLIEELDKADQEHQLSEYLQESSSDELATTAEEIAHWHKKKAEEMVEELLKKEQQQLSLISSRLPTVLEKQPNKKDKFVEGNSDIYADNGYKVFHRENKDENCSQGDDNAKSQVDSSDQTDIHFRETVPVHKLPIIKEKFQISKPSINRRGLQNEMKENSNSSDQSLSLSELEKEEKLINSYDTEYFDLFKSLREKLKIIEKSKHKKLTDLTGQIFLGDSSDASTEYLPIPNSLPGSLTDSKDELWKNLKLLNKNSKKIKQLCLDRRLKTSDDHDIKNVDKKQSKLRSSPKKIKSYGNKDFQSFNTPPRLYSEEIKSDGSGERPLTHKQKFEKCKKEVIEHYIKRLIQMNPENLNQLSVSSVEGSGISFPSEINFCDLLKMSFSLDSLSSTSHSIYNHIMSSSPKFATPSTSGTSDSITDDVDTIPVKLKSSKSDPCQLSIIEESNSETSANQSSTVLSFRESPNSSSTINQSLEQKVIEEVSARLRELQRMKLKILSVKQPADCYKQNSVTMNDSIHSRPPTTTDLQDGHYIMESEQRDETSFESSVVPSTYQTPPREESDSSFPNSRSSSLSAETSPPLWRQLKEFQHQPLGSQGQDFSRTSATMKEATQYIIQKNLNDLRAIMQTSPNLMESNTLESMSSSVSEDSVSHPSKKSEEQPVEKFCNINRSLKGEDKKTNKSSSSTNSLPDMNPILERFGLTWAHSMIRKMDEADENISSDSAKYLK